MSPSRASSCVVERGNTMPLSLLYPKTVLVVSLTMSFFMKNAEAHMPMFPGDSSPENPIDLGDITANSWAVAFSLKPNEVKYFKMDIEDHERTRFYMGLYVTASEQDKNFRFYSAFYGLGANLPCERWGDGWGRRLTQNRFLTHGVEQSIQADQVNSSQQSGWKTDTALSTSFLKRAVDSQNSIPERVYKVDGQLHQAWIPGEEDTLLLSADPEITLPNKYEPFSPTVFKPRGSCIADFPKSGKYLIAVYGDDDQDDIYHGCLGLGLTERDVFAFKNLVTFDYILWHIHLWNRWTPVELLWPIIAVVLLLWATAAAAATSEKVQKKISFGTVSKRPTLFQMLMITGGGMLIGHGIQTLNILVWATSIAEAEKPFLVIMLGIVLPITLGFFAVTISLNLFQAWCSCNKTTGRRVYAGIAGAFHLLAWHAGYIIGPALLLLAALLPDRIANRGLKENGADGLDNGSKDLCTLTGALDAMDASNTTIDASDKMWSTSTHFAEKKSGDNSTDGKSLIIGAQGLDSKPDTE